MIYRKQRISLARTVWVILGKPTRNEMLVRLTVLVLAVLIVVEVWPRVSRVFP